MEYLLKVYLTALGLYVVDINALRVERNSMAGSEKSEVVFADFGSLGLMTRFYPTMNQIFMTFTGD